jgi:hypothetical protein
MKNTFHVLVVLVAISAAVLGYTMISAEARSRDDNASRLPPISQRTSGESASFTSANAGASAGTIEFLVDPDTVDCTGETTTLVVAVVRDEFGSLVPNGTLVHFSTSNADATPSTAITSEGAASTQVTVTDPEAALDSGVEVFASSNGVQDSIVLFCAPDDTCTSPPPHPMSPPCDTAISLVAEPAQVACDGSESSTVTAYVVDGFGDPVPDGTNVAFSVVALATADPVDAPTVDGSASSLITPLGSVEEGITVIVTALDGQNQIRIDCPIVIPPSPQPCDWPYSPPSCDTTPDVDGDGLTEEHEFWLGTNPLVRDTDGDGCSDGEEMGLDPLFGGNREPLVFWDFYDVDDGSKTGTRDGKIDLRDPLFMLPHFGHGPSDDPFDNLLDRFIPDDAMPWRTAASDSGVTFTDILANLKSFGHVCEG